MKLRNKKTGEIFDLEKMPKWLQDSIQLTAIFYSRECEIYEPAEPLIKDEKIRKAVRAWAEALGRIKTFVVSYGVEYHDCCIYTSGLSDTAMIDLGTDLNVREGCYSITELCGEDEE